MTGMRTMNRPEDFKALGVNPNQVEPWEDGLRNSDATGCIEWWYFDFDTEEGLKVGMNFSTNLPTGSREPGYRPFVYHNIIFPDGKIVADLDVHPASDISFGDGKCDVHIGSSYVTGDLKNYHIHVESTKNNLVMDFDLKNLVTSWRPGTAFMRPVHDDVDGDTFFTWLCAVPKGEVSGVIRLQGKEYPVNGHGYHDHQWANALNYSFWDRWLWSRQQTNGFTVLNFDLVSVDSLGNNHVPLFFVEDENGNILFENDEKTDDVIIEASEETVDSVCGKKFPKVQKFTYKKGSMTAEYTLTADKELLCNDHYKNAPDALKAVMDQQGLHHTLNRYAVVGKLLLTDGNKVIADFSEDMVYEISSHYKTYAI